MYRYLICAVLPAAFALSAADVKIEAAEYSFGSPALPLVLRFGAADGLRYTLTLTDTFTGRPGHSGTAPAAAGAAIRQLSGETRSRRRLRQKDRGADARLPGDDPQLRRIRFEGGKRV